MSRALSPRFTLPPATVAPSVYRIALQRNFAATEELCSLTIRTRGDTDLERYVTHRLSRVWCEAAEREQASLVVRCSGNAIELYSTQRGSKTAYAHALRTIAAWSRRRPEFRQLELAFRRGEDAAAALLTSAADTDRRRSPVAKTQLEDVVRVASQAGSLCDVTASLFQAALEVHRRVAAESLVGDPEPSDVLADMAELCASRIVEEELLVWKTETARLYRSLSPARAWLPGAEVSLDSTTRGSSSPPKALS